MLAGEPYLPADRELTAARGRARELLRRYNRTSQEKSAERLALLRECLGSIGSAVWIEPPFFCDYGKNIFLGEAVYMNFGCVILDCARVTIGRQSFLGPYVQLLTAHHPIDPVSRSAGRELASPISIGERCWLGGGVIVCPGVSIGSGATVGAGSVVTRDIPPGVVAAGNPCRVLRRLLGPKAQPNDRMKLTHGEGAPRGRRAHSRAAPSRSRRH
jgi:maltose O-acetyltransferase